MLRVALPGMPPLTFAAGTTRRELEVWVARRLGVEPEDLDVPWMPGEDFEDADMAIGVRGGQVGSEQLRVELQGFPKLPVATFPRHTFLRAVRRSVAGTLNLPVEAMVFGWSLDRDCTDAVVVVQVHRPLPSFSARDRRVLFLSGAADVAIPAGFPQAAVLPCLAVRLGCRPQQIRLLLGTELFQGWEVASSKELDITACAVWEEMEQRPFPREPELPLMPWLL
jgi:hypothetical protein